MENEVYLCWINYKIGLLTWNYFVWKYQVENEVYLSWRNYKTSLCENIKWKIKYICAGEIIKLVCENN